MSYFDHVRCTACKAMLDPESLASRPGQGLTCPRCGAPLSLGDLFGLKDAFQEEEEGPVSLDDLVDGPAGPPVSRPPPAPAARSSAPPPRAAATPPAPSRPAPASKATTPPQLTQRGPAPAGGTALVKHGVAPADTPPSAPEPEPPRKGSALDAMRAMKRK